MSNSDVSLPTSCPLERCVSLTEARSRLEASLKGLGIEWELETSGRFFQTSICTLYDLHGNMLDRGFGKGDTATSKTGAIFEAAEHWFSRVENTNVSPTTYSDSIRYANQSTLPNNLLKELIRSSGGNQIALRSYTSLSNGVDQPYPVGLCSPYYIDGLHSKKEQKETRLDYFDYSRIEAYCSNSGVAIGSTEIEAIIHGLLETVERDSLSDFLVDAFLFRNAEAMRIVAQDSLPEDLKDSVRQAETEMGGGILILELKNKFGIPCFCSSLKNGPSAIENTGFGCSLSKEHALQRSVSELVQCYHLTEELYPAEFRQRTNAILSRLSPFPFHGRCAKAKIDEWSRIIGFNSINFDECSEVDYELDISSYLDLLVALIENCGHKVFSCVLAELPNGEKVVHSLFERQEHFFCVIEGSFVLPDLSRRANLLTREKYKCLP